MCYDQGMHIETDRTQVEFELEGFGAAQILPDFTNDIRRACEATRAFAPLLAVVAASVIITKMTHIK